MSHPDAWAFAGHGAGIFNVRPVNVVVTDEGELLPIDLIMRRLTQLQTKRLLIEGASTEFN